MGWGGEGSGRSKRGGAWNGGEANASHLSLNPGSPPLARRHILLATYCLNTFLVGTHIKVQFGVLLGWRVLCCSLMKMPS